MVGGLKMPLLGIEVGLGERRKRYGVRCSLDLGNPWRTNIMNHRPSLDFTEEAQRGEARDNARRDWCWYWRGIGFESCIRTGGGRGEECELVSPEPRDVTGRHGTSLDCVPYLCLWTTLGISTGETGNTNPLQTKMPIRGIVGCTGGRNTRCNLR